MKKKIFMAALAMTLLSFSCFPVYANEESSSKEEVVYVMMDAQGEVKETYVVNIFNDENIIDYGNYQDVKVLNTTDNIKQKGDCVHIQTKSNQLYYQGTLKDAICPWNISISYFLDGEKVSAKHIAGQSGQVEVQFDISQNEAYRGDYFKRFALQISFTLDSEKCQDLQAQRATIANAGNQKQISYIALPDKGLHASIKMDAQDFAMSAIAINGIDLNLSVDVDEEELETKIDELIDATAQINDGAQQLKTGNASLLSGYQALPQGAKELSDGLTALDQGIVNLQKGMKQVQSGLDRLDQKSATLSAGSQKMKDSLQLLQSSLSALELDQQQIEKLRSSSAQFQQNISTLYNTMISLQQNVGYRQYKAQMKANGLDVDALVSDNRDTISAIQQQIEQLQSMLPQYSQDPVLTQQLQDEMTQLNHVIALLKQNNQAMAGMENYLDTITNKIALINDQFGLLNDRYTVFNSTIAGMSDQFAAMITDLMKLSAGVNEIVTQYNQLDDGILQYTDGVTSLVSGYHQLLNGALQLSSGSSQLKTGSTRLYDGTQEVYENMTLLSSGSEKLAKGTNELHDQSVIMKDQVSKQIDDLLSGISGTNQHYDSFVSAKNTQVKSVQFVIQTDAVEKTEKTKAVKTEKKKSGSFIDKLLALFSF